MAGRPVADSEGTSEGLPASRVTQSTERGVLMRRYDDRIPIGGQQSESCDESCEWRDE